jgi:hypothetical protein
LGLRRAGLLPEFGKPCIIQLLIFGRLLLAVLGFEDMTIGIVGNAVVLSLTDPTGKARPTRMCCMFCAACWFFPSGISASFYLSAAKQWYPIIIPMLLMSRRRAEKGTESAYISALKGSPAVPRGGCPVRTYGQPCPYAIAPPSPDCQRPSGPLEHNPQKGIGL